MKKIAMGIMMTLFWFSFIPAQSEATPVAVPITSSNSANADASNALLHRLDEIDAMDKSTLNAPEKRALRKEVRTIKKELATQGGGVYLSVGALLLIIILLIVLL
jgi:hypothetical protein